MTRLAQRHEIVHVVGAALTKRENVVYLLGRSQLAMLLALFAERVCFDKAVAYSFPSTTVTLVCLRLTLEMIVVIVHLLLVLGAVKTARQLRTAGVLARALWFLWHDVTSVQAQEKPPQDFSRDGFSLSHFLYYHYTIFPYNINSHSLSTFGTTTVFKAQSRIRKVCWML